jgi:hypothetical protein
MSDLGVLRGPLHLLHLVLSGRWLLFTHRLPVKSGAGVNTARADAARSN